VKKAKPTEASAARTSKAAGFRPGASVGIGCCSCHIPSALETMQRRAQGTSLAALNSADGLVCRNGASERGGAVRGSALGSDGTQGQGGFGCFGKSASGTTRRNGRMLGARRSALGAPVFGLPYPELAAIHGATLHGTRGQGFLIGRDSTDLIRELSSPFRRFFATPRNLWSDACIDSGSRFAFRRAARRQPAGTPPRSPNGADGLEGRRDDGQHEDAGESSEKPMQHGDLRSVRGHREGLPSNLPRHRRQYGNALYHSLGKKFLRLLTAAIRHVRIPPASGGVSPLFFPQPGRNGPCSSTNVPVADRW
jgi:hypothetical protein